MMCPAPTKPGAGHFLFWEGRPVAPRWANSTPNYPTDGTVYANQMVMPGAEGVLYNGVAGSPLSVTAEDCLVASVTLTIPVTLASNVSYVVLQGDLGNDVWFDIAGIRTTAVAAGSSNFLIAAGAPVANAFEQTRASNTAPAGHFQNQCPLPGRVRFVGKATITGGAGSSSSGAGIRVLCTIRVKLQGLR